MPWLYGFAFRKACSRPVFLRLFSHLIVLRIYSFVGNIFGLDAHLCDMQQCVNQLFD